MTLPEILTELTWSVGGLIVGYLLGRLTRRAAVDEHGPETRHDRRERRQDVARAIIGVIILVLGIAASIRYYQVTSCQQDYLNAVQVALDERSEAQGRELRAQIKLLTIPEPERDGAIAEYVAAITELERVRAAHPLPPPSTCGETS